MESPTWLLLRRLYWMFLVLLVSGCSGGGCSGCAGGAIQPMPGGYPLTPDTRIPRAAQIRLTENGLRRVEAIAPGLLGSFVGTGIPVPRSVQPVNILGQTACRAIICTSPSCNISVSLPPAEALRLSFTDPNAILARVRVQASGDIPIRACCGGCNDSCGGFLCVTIASPTLQVRTERGSHPYLGLSTKVSISRDTHAPRSNYHRADIVSPTGMGDAVQETMGEGIEGDDIRCTDSWVCGLVNLLSGTIVNQFRSQFAQALGPIQEALAQSSMPNPPGCPMGTTADGNRCRYSDRSLVPTLLGTEGRGNFGSLLASVSPGVNAPASLVLAAGDPMRDGHVVNGGMSINMFGAMQSQRHNACVPRVPAPPMPNIPEWNALRMNVVPGTTTGVDLGIGLAEDYLNWSLFQLWDAGMFCLAAGSNLSSMLSAGTFASLPPLNSLRTVIYPGSTGPLAIVLRPQQPPTARIGGGSNLMTDPLIRLTLPRVALDFYTWSEERYVRFMTLTTTISIPVNLQADAMGLQPTLGEAQVDMITPSVNTQLISNNPALIGPIVQSILGPALSMLGGSLNPIALPNIDIPGTGGRSLGSVRIVVPPRGVQGVTEGMSRFLGIFAQLQYVPAMARPQSLELDTTATLEGVDVNRALWTAAGLRRENLPAVTFTVGTPNDFGRGVEYSYRLDRGSWSMFSTERRYTLRDWSFVGQGRHVIEVRARSEGEPTTADGEPARIEFIIDTEAPELSAQIVNGEVVATAHDGVSERLEYAFQFDDAPRSPWAVADRARLPEGYERVRVFARDESGNTSDITLGASRLIRGGPSTDAASGCGCAVPGRGSSGGGLLAVLATLAGAGVLSARRRRRAKAVAFVALAAAIQGCAEGTSGVDGSVRPDGGGDAAACGNNETTCGGRCVATPACTNMCMPGFMQSGAASLNMTTCMPDTSMCTCVELPPLNPGSVGSHLHMAAATDGSLWLSAYSPGDPGGGVRYGDLVVGRWRSEMMAVDWTHADGVPAGGTITGSVTGWRGGNSTAGDDVGQFNSIAVGADNNPRVAYWDATNNRLKFASCMGTTCRAHTVDMNGANGRYASLALVGGVPVIAYRAAVATMTGFNSVVRLARANNAAPAGPADWTISDVATLPSACRPAECAMGTVCLRTGRCGPMPMAMSEVFDRTTLEALTPGAHYINLVAASDGRLAVVWYHRDRGNLMLAQGDMMGRFSAPVVLDGEGAMMRDTGDRGIYASAAFDRDGLLHVAYVDGWDEGLMYLRARNGMPMGAPESVDDGSGVESMTFDDGRHIVGDSASLSVAMDGTVRVAYQDTTVGTLRLATRGAMGWTRTVLDRMNHTGYWATSAANNVATFWRDLSMSGMPRYGVRVFPLR
jgi:hypothetical protein